MEDGQTSAMDEKEELENNNEAMDTKTEKNYQLLTKFAKEKDLPLKLSENYLFARWTRDAFWQGGKLHWLWHLSRTVTFETLELFEAEGRKSYPKAVESCLANHGLGQEQGQAWQRQAQTVARSSFGPWLCFNPLRIF